MAKPVAKVAANGEKPVDLFGMVEVKRGQFAVVRCRVEGLAVTDSELLFEPEDKRFAFNNLRLALVRHQYPEMVP